MPFFSKPKSQPDRQDALAELHKTLRRAGNDAADAQVHLREIIQAFEAATTNLKMELACRPMI